MKARSLLILLLNSALSLTALQWPFPGASPVGSFLLNSFFLDLDGSGGDAMVSPVMEGDIIFIYTPEDWNILALGDRSLLVMEHDNGYRSLYELSRIHTPLLQRERLTEADDIGDKGSGPLSLGIWDLESRSWVNPRLILPGSEDRQGVAIHQIRLTGDRGTFDLAPDNTLPSGGYRLQIRAEDLTDRKGGTPLLPFRIQCRYLGDSFLDLEFSAARYEDHRFRVVQGGVEADSLVSGPDHWINLGEINLGRGKADLEITLWDFSGNSRSYIYILRGGQ